MAQLVLTLGLSATLEPSQFLRETLSPGLQLLAIPTNVVGYLRKQRSGERVAPPGSLATFGYQADAVWSDPVVTEFCEAFGVEPERHRMVDTCTGS